MESECPMMQPKPSSERIEIYHIDIVLYRNRLSPSPPLRKTGVSSYENVGKSLGKRVILLLNSLLYSTRY